MKYIHSKSQAPEDRCTNIRNMLSSKWWNNKASDIKLVCLYSIIKLSFVYTFVWNNDIEEVFYSDKNITTHMQKAVIVVVVIAFSVTVEYRLAEP